MKKIKKKKSGARRSRTPYPALRQELNLRIRYENIDYDYIDKLSDDEKKWLNKFTEEYTNASFNNNKKPLHKTNKLRKDCYDRNNARNRDIMSRSKAKGDGLLYIEDLKKEVNTIEFKEDDLIAQYLDEQTEQFNDPGSDTEQDT